MKCLGFVKVVAAALCVAAAGAALADGPWEIEGGWSNEVLNAQNKTEYVIAFTNTSQSYTYTIPSRVYSLQYLVVAGGGGGGGHHGGGGGAGGLLSSDAYPVSSGDVLTITVGAGGAGGPNKTSGSNGGNSTVVNGAESIVAYGGGGGGGIGTGHYEGKDGGSGGGCCGSNKATASLVLSGGSPVEGQGNAGGNRGAVSGNTTGKGGGGAGSSPGTSKNGGSGVASSITGEEVYYAGGGGGGGYAVTANSHGTGGTGGGGDGGSYSSGGGYVVGSPGVTSTGGGGGGGGWTVAGGRGGSGIVIFRYAVSDASGGIVVSSDGGGYGSPDPAYGAYNAMPTNEYTCQEYVVIDDGVRAYCTGWRLYDSGGALLRSSDNLESGESAQKAILGSEAEGGTLKWQWEVRYFVEFSGEGGGTVENKTGWYPEGTVVSALATPAANYSLGKWKIDGAFSANTANPIQIEVGDSPMTVEAVFIGDGITVYYDGLQVGGYDTLHKFDYNVVGTTYEITCPKYVVLEANSARKRCIGYTLKLLPDGEESQVYPVTGEGEMTAEVEFASQVMVTWKWTNEYYIVTTTSGRGTLVDDKTGWYEPGTVITGIEVSNTRNFKGWEGFTGGHTGASVSYTVGNSAHTITAHFTESDRENLVLNGDFELNSNPSHNVTAIRNFNRLTAGSWSVEVDSGSDDYVCGILAAITADSFATNIRTYDGLSGMVSSRKSTSASGCVSCEVNLPCSGIYEVSLVCRRGVNGNGIGSNTWDLTAELVKGETVLSADFPIGVIGGYQGESAQLSVPKGGSYKLKLIIYASSIAGEKDYACMAFDNVSLRLVKTKGFVISLR